MSLKSCICRSCGLFFITSKDKSIVCPCCKKSNIKILKPLSNSTLTKMITEPSENGFAYKGNDFSYDYFGKENLPPDWSKMIKW